MTNEQRKFLLDLQIDPLWKTILDDLEPAPIPAYRPSRSKDDLADEQTLNWVYSSGRHNEAKHILSILRGEVK